MSSSVIANNLGADHRANPAAYYAVDRSWQAIIKPKIRIPLLRFINSGKLSHRYSHPSLVTEKTCRKPQIKKFLASIVLFAALWGLTGKNQLLAKNPQQNSGPQAAVDAQLSAKLLSDYRFSIHEKPLRDTLHSLAERSQINLWLDREIDPTTLITTGADARTLYQAISASARSAGASVSVVDNVVLVGRNDWVERVAGAVLAMARGGTKRDISWTELATPTVAAASCVTASQQPLPHDLWPGVHWKQIDAAVALLLVAAQFDLMPSNQSGGSYSELAVPEKLSALYPVGKHAASMRAAILQADTKATMKESNAQLLVTGTAAAHQAATTTWLGYAALTQPKKLDIDKVQFSLELKKKPAEQVFAQLAGAAGRVLVIHPNAVELCKQSVTLSEKDKTIRSLSESIAKAAGVAVTWSDAELRVALK